MTGNNCIQSDPNPRTIVIKIGSAVLLRDGVHPDRPAFCGLVQELSNMASSGLRIVVVSSGAVATGLQKLRLERRPGGERNIPTLQALAALGQASLMQSYESEFGLYNLLVAQILLTRDDFTNRTRYINARRALSAVHSFCAIPIVNENDTVATEEIRFGDNDQLAAMVAAMVSAELLVLLSDVDGLYTSDPHKDPTAKRIDTHRAYSPDLDSMVDGSNLSAGVGTGGMKTKLLAARLAASVAIPTVIAPGKQPGILAEIMGGHDVGTRLTPEPGIERLAARKAWIGTGLVPKGKIKCDKGAVEAIVARSKSLLPSGIVGVEGDFQEGDAVELIDCDGRSFAQGLSSYSASAVRIIMGHQSSQITALLGYRLMDAVVQRDELVVDLQFQPHQ